jgi:hypothetical protein
VQLSSLPPCFILSFILPFPSYFFALSILPMYVPHHHQQQQQQQHQGPDPTIHSVPLFEHLTSSNDVSGVQWILLVYNPFINCLAMRSGSILST